MTRLGRAGFWVGAALLAGALVWAGSDLPRPAALGVHGLEVLGIAGLMAVWWLSEALPLAATALVPLVAFPLLGITPVAKTATAYGDPLLMLFLGGFLMARALERWGLHRRLALGVVSQLGTSPRRLVLSFLGAAALLSMWVSNTATALMMLPIAAAVIARVRAHSTEGGGRDPAAGLAVALLLAIAYGANIGGMGTPIGTPPNMIFLGIYHDAFPAAPPITFFRWMLVGLPLVALLLLFTGWYLTSAAVRLPPALPRAATEEIAEERRALGPMSPAERRVALIFLLAALAWIFRRPIPLGNSGLAIPGWSQLLPRAGFVDDGTVAIAAALAMFVVPAGRGGKRLLDWPTAVRIPWGILLLFGGGIALARGFSDSGLSAYLGGALGGLAGIPEVLVVLLVALSVTFLTEITSNTAVTTLLLPVLAAAAAPAGVAPLVLMLTATLSASCAFMMPVATPPNAVVFATGDLPIRAMARAGLVINLVGALLITATVELLGPLLLG